MHRPKGCEKCNAPGIRTRGHQPACTMSQHLSPLDYAMHMAITVHYILIDVEKKRRIRLRTVFHTSRSNCCRGAVTPEGYLGYTQKLRAGLLGWCFLHNYTIFQMHFDASSRQVCHIVEHFKLELPYSRSRRGPTTTFTVR